MTDRCVRAPSLRELQRQLAAHIAAPDAVNAAVLTPVLALPSGAEAAERLAVYASGYPARLHEALAEQFPALAHLVGTRRFTALVHRFIAAATLPSYNLNDAGAELPAFVAADTLAAELPFLPDLATLEWTVARSFHARDLPPLELSAVAGWTMEEWASAVLRFQPSVAVCVSRWPLRALWESVDTPLEAIDLDLGRADHVVVRRDGLVVRCESVSAGEADALERLRHGEALGVVAAARADAGSTPADILGWFARWMNASMITGVEHRR